MDKPLVDYPAMGRRIRARRRALGLTQGQLATMIGVSTSFIGHLERAQKIPSLETVVKLCRCLDTDANALVFGRSVRCAGNCPLYRELAALLRSHQF